MELLVEAGFTPEEAIRIATLNGATFLGEDSRIGTLATGGYDPAKLIESVRGLVGEK